MNHMKNYLILLSILILSSCASVQELEVADHCLVWRDQPIFGPTAVSAGNKSASWSGHCKNLWWGCKNVTGYIEDNGDVYIHFYEDYKQSFDQQKPIGKITNNIFTDSRENPFSSIIDTSPMRVDFNDLSVKYNVKFRPIYDAKEVSLRFNKACSAEDALIGVLVLNAVGQLQSETNRP